MTIRDLIKNRIEIEKDTLFISYYFISNGFSFNIDKNYDKYWIETIGEYQLEVLSLSYKIRFTKNFYENFV